MDDSRLLKLKLIAMVAVILEEEGGEFIQPSPHRNRGNEWARDHRRVRIGRRTLFMAMEKRSNSRLSNERQKESKCRWRGF